MHGYPPLPAGDALDLDEIAEAKVFDTGIVEGSHRRTAPAIPVNLLCCGALLTGRGDLLRR
jgi:hypothetical protein